MVKIIYGIENAGKELKCDQCNLVLHFEENDLIDFKRIIHGKEMHEWNISCPKCGSFICVRENE